MRLTVTTWLRDRYGQRRSPLPASARSVGMEASRPGRSATERCSWQGVTWSSMGGVTRDQSTRWIRPQASIYGNTVLLGRSFLPWPTPMASSLTAQAPPWKSLMPRVAPVCTAIPRVGISTRRQASPMGRSIPGAQIIMSMPLAWLPQRHPRPIPIVQVVGPARISAIRPLLERKRLLAGTCRLVGQVWEERQISSG